MAPTFATCSPTKPTRPTVAQAATTRSGPVSATRSWSLVRDRVFSRRTDRAPRIGHLELLAGKLLDVHVSERHDVDVGDEPGRPVHVPHPRVSQLQLEVGTAVVLLDVELDVVREVEAALGL